MARCSSWLAAVAAAALLGACGGGGGGGSTTTTSPSGGSVTTPVPTVAKGLWSGRTTGSRTLTGFVFDDGGFSILYSSPNAPDTVAGMVQGTGSGVDGAFASGDAIDFNLEGRSPTTMSLSATVVAGTSFNGSLGADGVTFSTLYDTDYDVPATLAGLAGSYTGKSARASSALSSVLTISDTGVLSGTGAGCTVTGTVAVRSGANAYGVSLAFSGEDCAFAGAAFSGIAYYDASTRRLYLMAPSADRSDALMFLGDRG